MADLDERDELESGLTSGFWSRFTAHAEQEWGTNGERFRLALKSALGGQKTAEESVQMLRMLTFCNEEIAKLLAWPKERLGTLDHAKAPAGVSRRGGL